MSDESAESMNRLVVRKESVEHQKNEETGNGEILHSTERIERRSEAMKCTGQSFDVLYIYCKDFSFIPLMSGFQSLSIGFVQCFFDASLSSTEFQEKVSEEFQHPKLANIINSSPIVNRHKPLQREKRHVLFVDQREKRFVRVRWNALTKFLEIIIDIRDAFSLIFSNLTEMFWSMSRRIGRKAELLNRSKHDADR